MLLIYGNPAIWETMSDEERNAVLRLHAALAKELRESGELVGGAALADPEHTTTVRGGVATTIEGHSRKPARSCPPITWSDVRPPSALAARILDPHVPAVEVRPVLHTVDLEL